MWRLSCRTCLSVISTHGPIVVFPFRTELWCTHRRTRHVKLKLALPELSSRFLLCVLPVILSCTVEGKMMPNIPKYPSTVRKINKGNTHNKNQIVLQLENVTVFPMRLLPDCSENKTANCVENCFKVFLIRRNFSFCYR